MKNSRVKKGVDVYPKPCSLLISHVEVTDVHLTAPLVTTMAHVGIGDSAFDIEDPAPWQAHIVDPQLSFGKYLRVSIG